MTAAIRLFEGLRCVSVCVCVDHLSSLSVSMSFFQYAFCRVLYSFLSRFTCVSLAE